MGPDACRRTTKSELITGARMVILRGHTVDLMEDQLVDRVIRVSLLSFALKNNRWKVAELRADLIRDVRGNRVNPADHRVREVLNKRIVAYAPLLFKFSLEARVNAVLLLGELSEEFPGRFGGPARAYIPARGPLLDLLADADRLRTALHSRGIALVCPHRCHRPEPPLQDGPLAGALQTPLPRRAIHQLASQ